MPEPVYPQNPFVTDTQGSKLTVWVSGSMRDDGWAAHFYELQIAMRERRFQSKCIDHVELDLSNCIWADPLPLLAFTMALGELVKQGGKATVVLPVSNQPEVEPKRLLRFMALEGFAGQMLDLGIAIKNSQYPNIDHPQIEEFAAIEVPLRYADSHCIPVWILHLSKDIKEAHDQIEKGISDRLALAEVLLRSEERPWANTRLLYTLKVFLRETLINIAEHAYENKSEDRLAAVYVRYRTGGLRIPSAEKSVWLQELSKEEDRCPQLRRSYLENKAGCLEAFTIDTGIGMVERFVLEENKREKFDALLKSVFFEGATTKKNRPTRAGGLELVHNALRQNHDYLRGLDDNLWVGFQAEYPREGAAHRRPALLRGEGAPFRGLAWTARLSWPESTVMDSQWAIWQGTNVHPALTLFRDQTAIANCKGVIPIVLDQRFGTSGRLTDVISPTNDQDVLWLVRPGLMKNDILAKVEEIAQVHRKGGPYDLYIADIPDHEAATYLAAVNFSCDHRQTWPNSFRHIVLITRSLAISVHVYSSNATHGYVTDTSATNRFRFDASAWKELQIARWIRHHDSEVFWKVIDEHKSDLTYIQGRVRWLETKVGYGQTIEGYLDFLQTLTYPLCLDLYRIAIQRFAGLFPNRIVFMQPMDRLTVTLAEEFNANQPAEAREKDNIRLGSVYVSGRTLDAFGKSGGELATIHFFLHSSSTAAVDESRLSLLLWSPHSQRPDSSEMSTNELSESVPQYGRIGKTHAVGRGGGRHFLVPRFDDTGRPLSTRTPAETYNDWQQPLMPLLASGHWAYESHHDFITLNLYQAINFAFLGHDPLARYLFREVVLPLTKRGFERDCSSIGKQLWSRTVEDMQNHRLREQDLWQARAVVYPSHPNTASVVDRLLGCFLEEKREKLRNRFIPVLPVRRRQGRGAMLLSPLALERIKKLLEEQDDRQPNILFFDDAIVTGRTVREFTANLHAMGAKEVRMVSILDRLRLPAGGQKPERIRFFWRWDLADLGTRNSCTLCKALDLARQLSKAVTSSRAQERLQKWCQTWEPASPVSQWHKALRPTPLQTPLTKRLSLPTPLYANRVYEPSKDLRRQVRLRDSAAVAS
jgi:hypothetical protein